MLPHKMNALPNGDKCLCCAKKSIPRRGSRLKYWEVDHFFKCPVVGMCLTPAEQKQILKKVGPKIKKMSPFELHEVLVSSAESENKISRRIDTLLNRKLGKAAMKLLMLKPRLFVEHCLKSFKAGDYLPGLWATAISPDLPLEMKKEIFGEIHMTMHWSGEESIRFKRKLTLQAADLEKAHQGCQEALRIKREQLKALRVLKREVAGLQSALEATQNEKVNMQDAITELSSSPRVAELARENRYLQANLQSERELNARQQHQLTLLGEENGRLSRELDNQRASALHFKQEARSAMEDFFAVNRCDKNCPSFDLCEKRVLIVGGITRMESLYRELIEGSGGVFEYHDGYMRKGTRGLEGRLKRADVVLCPVSCNSHAACSAVKNLAKKHRKKVHMLANFSLNAVSRILAGGNSARGTINPGISQN